jgi:arylsulfatase A-like enzyme
MRLLESLTVLMLGLAPGECAEADPPPNVVFVLDDDLGWNDVSLSTSTPYETPHLDAFRERRREAKTSPYSEGPLLLPPTPSGILTGNDPARITMTAPHRHLPVTRGDAKEPGEIRCR